MATLADVRRIALSLPGAELAPGDRLKVAVRNKDKLKGFVWVWLERIHPKKARVPQPKVVAVRVANLIDKDLLLQADTRKFFTEPHYNGYPAVMVRLSEVTVKELRELITESWRCLAPTPKDSGAKRGRRSPG
jgi:hypothetical protein